jgi:hypothetical protein
MSRSVIWLFALVGSTVGGALPALWGGSMLGLSSLALATLGGVAGVLVGARVSA